MFGTHPKPIRPTLFILVFGAFIALVGITATAQAVMVGEHFSTATLNDVVSSDAATTRAFVNAYVRPEDLAPAPSTAGGGEPAEPTSLEAQLATLIRPGEILRIELRRPDGTIVAANDPGVRGLVVPVGGDFALAVGGRARAAILPAGAAEAGPDPSAPRRSCASTCRSPSTARCSAWSGSGGMPSRSSLDSMGCDATSSW